MSYTPLKTLQIPTVRNLRESEAICHEFGAVLTVGPEQYEVKGFRHPNHKIVSFDDVASPSSPFAPRLSQILDAVTFGIGQDNLLVHCHAGISRSTATAWGVAIGNGVDPEHAIKTLSDAHPYETGYYRNGKRPFSPNLLIVKHLQDIFGYKNGELVTLLDKYSSWNF
jgi:predicted protein tyrosine phosphatase